VIEEVDGVEAATPILAKFWAISSISFLGLILKASDG